VKSARREKKGGGGEERSSELIVAKGQGETCTSQTDKLPRRSERTSRRPPGQSSRVCTLPLRRLKHFVDVDENNNNNNNKITDKNNKNKATTRTTTTTRR
jgi:hypothetical protein